MQTNQMRQAVQLNHVESFKPKNGEISSAKRSQRLSIRHDLPSPMSLKQMKPSPVRSQMNVFKTTAQGIIQSQCDSNTAQKLGTPIKLKSFGRMRASLPGHPTNNLDFQSPKFKIQPTCLSPTAFTHKMAGTSNRLTQSAIKQFKISSQEVPMLDKNQSDQRGGLHLASVETVKPAVLFPLQGHESVNSKHTGSSPYKSSLPEPSRQPKLYDQKIEDFQQQQLPQESNILVQSGINAVKLISRSKTINSQYQSMSFEVHDGTEETNLAMQHANQETPALVSQDNSDTLDQFVLDLQMAQQSKIPHTVLNQVSGTPEAQDTHNEEPVLRLNSIQLLKIVEQERGQENRVSSQNPSSYLGQRISDIDYAKNVDRQLEQKSTEMLLSNRKISQKIVDQITENSLHMFSSSKRETHNFGIPMSASTEARLDKVPALIVPRHVRSPLGGTMQMVMLNSQDKAVTVKQAKDAIADGSPFSKQGKSRSFTSNLQPYVKNGADDASKYFKNVLHKQFQDSPVVGNFEIQVSTGMQRIQSFDVIAENNNQRSYSNENTNQIEEEMTFEELSSKLGDLKTNALSYDDDATMRRTFNVIVSGQGPFGDLSSSVHISAQSLSNSAIKDSKNQSVDFKNLPALLQIADRGGSATQGYEENGTLYYQMDEQRPRFDYDLRQYNHFSVNKMTGYNQTGINRGSFVELGGVDDKIGRGLPDYTNEKQGELWNRMRSGHMGESDKHLERNIGIQPDHQSASVSRGKAMEQQQQLLWNLETPIERSDLYDEYDIHHDMLQDASIQSGIVYIGDEMKSVKTQRTILSEIGTDGALIPETGIESKYHTRPISKLDFQQASHGHPKTYDLSQDSSDDLGDRLAHILNNAAAGSTIRLPATEIEVPTLIIRKHLKIQGQPGTSLFFKATTLIFDFSSDSEQKDERNFRHVEPVIFSEIQFLFSIDLRAIAYSKQMGRKHYSNSLNSKGSKQAPMPHNHQSRTLVQLIQIKSGSKVEFRDCSFRCAKVYHQRRTGTNSSNAGCQSQKVRNKTDRSQRHDHSQKPVINHTTTLYENYNLIRQDSASAGLSEKHLSESSSLNKTSGRILGRYFANEKEEEQILRENVQEVCFWMNAEAMNEHPSCVHEFSKDRIAQRFSSQINGSMLRPYQGSVLLQSCVLTGFYNQIRAGCNATIELDKCYMQESMSSALMLVNPCYLRMVESNLIRTQINSGINIRWLSDSIDKHISRVIDIQQNDIGLNYCCGIEIQGNVHAAHNLKIDISKNFIYRNKKEGLLVQNLAATAMLLYGNEFSKNEGDNLKISHFHHKSNKRNRFRLENCQIEYSKGGFGANLFDTSFTIKNCIVKGNQSGGIFCGCPDKPTGLPSDALWFLKKFPMSVKISCCEVTQNMHYGILVQDFWKGSVIIKGSLIQHNCNFGIYIHAKEPPIKESSSSKQKSLNHNVFSLNQGLNEDLSAALFKNTGPLNMRRLTLPLSPSQATNPFNISQSSMGNIMQNPLFKRKMTMQNILGSAPSQQNLKISTMSQNILDKQNNQHNIKNLQRVQMPTVEILESSYAGSKFVPQITPKNTQMNLQQQQQLTGRGVEIDDEVDAPITTERGLLHKSQSEIGQFKSQQALMRNNSAVPMTEKMLDSRVKESPIVMKQHNNSIGFGSSIIASIRRKVNNRSDSSKKSVGQINMLACREQDADNAEISKQIAAQILHQIDLRCILEKQELGKVYIIGGTGIIKNGGAGVAVRHCYLEIDSHAKTRVQDNDFAYQVYVMLKQCQPLLSGFEKAIIDHRIRGRKVLVGGGWGQITPQIPASCCGGFLKLATRCCTGSRLRQSNNKVMDASTAQLQTTQIQAGMQSPDIHRRQTQNFVRATVETPDIARVNTADVINRAATHGNATHGNQSDQRVDARGPVPRQEHEGESKKKCTIF